MNVSKKEMDAIVRRVGDKTTAKKPTETKHTPEPWKAQGKNIKGDTCRSSAKITYARADSRGKLLPGYDEANAARIVACVNSCKGINPEAVTFALDALVRCVEILEAVEGMPVSDGLHMARKAIRDLTATPEPRP